MVVIFVWRFTGRSFIHGEADFDGHLPVMHFSLFNVAARFNHLKPAQVLDGFVRALNGLTTASSMEVVEVPVSSMIL
jgi:hypothetical protein